MQQSRGRWAWCLVWLVVAGCGDSAASDGPDVDAGTREPGATGGQCSGHADCDDGLFCNGSERCVDQRCEAGVERDCDDGVECTVDRCDEESVACEHVGPDEDGDGFADARCVGPGGIPFGVDCDDDDAQRFPGNLEVCDVDAHDEDCDLTTYGARDLDNDGHNDRTCCNVNSEGTELCGDDCDDTNADIAPSKQEVCNDVDDNCNALADEGLPLTSWSPDCDGDGFGDAFSPVVLDCASPAVAATCAALSGTWVDKAGDCDESAAGRNPGAPEVCNFADDDCDGLIDDVMSGAVICYAGQTRTCTNVCGQPGEETCSGSCLGYGTCLAAEACNGCDDDGNGSADDGFACARGVTETCTTACGTEGTRICGNTCEWSACRAGSETCNYCDDDGDGDVLDERSMATETTNDAGVACGDDLALGGAECLVPSNSNTLEFYASLLDGSALPQEGAYWVDTGRFTGWGRVRIEAELEARMAGNGDPLGGWSLIVADATSALGIGKDGAVGIAVDWYWQSEVGTGPAAVYPPNAGDQFTYRKLFGTGNGAYRGDNSLGLPNNTIGFGISDSAAHLDAGDTSFIKQKVVIDYTPDDPVTGANEEVVAVTIGAYTTTYQADQQYWTVDPSHDLALHTPLAIGFVAHTRAKNYSWDGGPPGGVDFGAPVEARVHLSTMQIPTGPNPPTWTYHVKYTRAAHCPGL